MESAFFDAIHICETETEFNLIRDRQPNEPNQLSETNLTLAFDSRFRDIGALGVKHTFDYIFYKFKKGIYVKIKDGKLVSYIPFDNVNYINEFWNYLKPPPEFESVTEYLTSVYQAPQLPPHKWYANNSMFRTDNFKGHNNVEILYKWLLELCESRSIQDIEFFINRRDFPLLKKDPYEPYDHIFGDSFPLISHNYSTYAPIISFSVDTTFADIMLPTFEDWARVWFQEDGITVPRHHRKYPNIVPTPWDKKIPKVIFRGQTTGSGFDYHTNQRLKAFVIGQKHRNIFDIQFNKFSYRFRKHKSSPYIYAQTFPGKFKKAAYMTAQDQSKYKFILNLEGHVAAYRLSYELSFGSCILLAKSRWSIWYQNMLQPWVHYVPVKEDLSDLIEKAQWCLQHDDACKQIALNAMKFYKKYLNKSYMLDFCETTLNQLAEFCGSFEHISKPNLVSQLNPWAIANEKHQIFRQTVSVKNIRHEISFFRSIENLQAIEIVLAENHDSLIMTELLDGTHFTNIFGCLIKRLPENISACQVGYLCLNPVLHEIPNFLYTFPSPKDYFIECLCGVSFELFSAQCDLEDLKSVILQIVCALQHSQLKSGFIHGSLTIHQLIIMPLKEPMTISYQVSSVWNIVHTTKFLCVIQNFQKSRGIAYDPQSKRSVNVGNLSTPADKFLDIRTLYESIPKDTLYYNVISQLLSQGVSPAECIESFSRMGVDFAWWDTQMYSAMQEGNVWYKLFLFAGHNHKSALDETFECIVKQGIFDSHINLFTEIGKELFKHRNKWIHEQFINSHLKWKWKTFLSKTSEKLTYSIFPSFKYPSKLVSEPINDWTRELAPDPIEGNWIIALDLLYFAFRLGIAPMHAAEISLLHCDGYDLLRNIAAINDRYK